MQGVGLGRVVLAGGLVEEVIDVGGVAEHGPIVAEILGAGTGDVPEGRRPQVAGTTPCVSAPWAGTAQSGFIEGSLALDSDSSTRRWHLGQRLGIIVCLHVRCGSRV